MSLDDYIVDRECLLSPFRKVHPNFITVAGLISNILIIFLLIKGYIYLASLFLIIKFFCDTLDGQVARKYNKTSKLGGYLDTISDITLLAPYCGAVAWSMTGSLTYALCTLFVSLLTIVGYTARKGTFHDHSNLKGGGTNAIEKAVEFTVNNSIIFYIIIIIFNFLIF
jgi:phosphatidylglycerophosphate synthase